PAPTLSMVKSLNVATPPDAAIVVVPDSVPPAGLLAIAIVTLPANCVAWFPNASRALTVTPGMGTVFDVETGCNENTSSAAGPGVMSNESLVTAGTPLALADKV